MDLESDFFEFVKNQFCYLKRHSVVFISWSGAAECLFSFYTLFSFADPILSTDTAQFYTQREKKLGNYPMIDVFVAAKWKRMRILAKMQHLNDNLFGDRNYFTVLHYPQNKRVFKMGFSWSFYDWCVRAAPENSFYDLQIDCIV